MTHSISNITNIISYCYSKWDGSPLDIAKEKGRTAIVSMMTAALECESKELSPKVLSTFSIHTSILLCDRVSVCLSVQN